MNYNADHFLQVEMSRYDLQPNGPIVWDGEYHRMPGAGKRKTNEDGWYKAFPDRDGALFGDFSIGLKIHWKAARKVKPSKEERAAWRKQNDERLKKQADEYALCREEARAIWNGADRDASAHLYLVNKGIEVEKGYLRVSRKMSFREGKDERRVADGMLLAPMRLKGKLLVNIQRIWPNGKKLFWWGQSHEATATIGVKLWDREKNPRIYVCEGWATGWTVSKATGCAVIVAFSASGLLPVAKLIRKQYGDDLPLCIVADNDRWKEIKHRDGPIPNPGVYYAREAAKAVRAEIVIPDFHDLDGKPTDFHDLRQREGFESVMEWLDPAKAEEATTVAVPDRHPDDDVPEGEVPASEDEWLEKAPFRCLGVRDGIYFYVPTTYGQMVEMPAAGHSNTSNMYRLADNPEWWRLHFPLKGGEKVDWEKARAACLRACHNAGTYERDKVRGRGCWTDEDGELVMHLGDRLLPPGAKKCVTPEAYESQGRVYIREGRVAGPSRNSLMPLSEAQVLLDMFESRAWVDDAAGILLAGFVVLAPFGGALPWRPHVWVKGVSGSGKTTIVKNMVKPLLSGMILAPGDELLQGDTTEAAIRQELKHDSLPVIIDEVDKDTKRAETRIRGLMSLLRSASSGGVVSKGTTGGHAMRFRINSMFLLSSISMGLKQESEKARVAVLGLQAPAALDPDKRRMEWIEFQETIKQRITPAAARRLVARTASWFRDGRFTALHATTTAAAAIVLSDQRAADQYGGLIAGAWILKSDELPKREEVVHWLKDIGLSAYLEETMAEGIKIIDFVFQVTVTVKDRGDLKEATIGELVDSVVAGSTMEDTRGTVSVKEAETKLKRCGIRLERTDPAMGAYTHLLIANNNEWLTDQLANTPYSDGWLRIIRSISGATPVGNKYFHSKLRSSRGTLIPLEVLSGAR